MKSGRGEHRAPTVLLGTERPRLLLAVAYRRLQRRRPLLGTAGAVFVALAVAGAMAPWAAVIGFATLAALFSLIGEQRPARDMV
ncbi:MAG TPA: hypothetical protein VE665_05840, partial [Hyphomicrobiaceae bacterium]|nr:hypothetical protein [Hyphomicrobiaceae bacterium]